MNQGTFHIIPFYVLIIGILLITEAITAHTPASKNPQDLDTITQSDTIRLGRNVNYRRGKADAYLMLAALEQKKDDPAGMLRYYLSALYELEILGDSVAISGTQVKIGDIFYARALYNKALEYYSAAEQSMDSEKLTPGKDTLLIRIGNTYYKQEDYPLALQYFERTTSIPGSDSLILLARQRIVLCYNAMRQYDKALSMNQKLLEYYRRKQDQEAEIILLNNIGFTHRHLDNLETAMAYFEEAASLEIKRTGSTSPRTLINRAIVYQNMGNNQQALKMLDEATRKLEKSEDSYKTSETFYLTALVYYNLEDYHNSLIYNDRVIRFEEKKGYSPLLEKAYLLASRLYQALYDYEEAMVYFQQHLMVRDSLQRAALSSKRALNRALFQVEEITRETERLWAAEELSNLELQRLKLDSANRQQELEILYKTDSIQRITIENQRLEFRRAQQELLLKEEQIYAARKAKEVDSLRQIEAYQAVELERNELKQKQQEAQIKLLDQEKEIAELEVKKVRTRNAWLLAFGVLAIFIIYGVVRGLRFARRTNKILVKQKNEIERQKDEIDYERQRSDKLLLNILPEETAEELKEKGSATPRHYQMVSVLFTDFKGFTKIAEKLTPNELVEELNSCFLAFDNIIDDHNLEKIKTIGDAYMCAGGIPVENETNPVDIVKAGLEIKRYMAQLKEEKESKGEDFWELRIGIHTGPVIAGVVGKNKFAYDIWGDAVNTASRMESSGIPGQVNISGETFNLVKERFKCTYRGKIQAKNKGEIDMYIVEEIKND